jgi:hypothetical protein
MKSEITWPGDLGLARTPRKPGRQVLLRSTDRRSGQLPIAEFAVAGLQDRNVHRRHAPGASTVAGFTVATWGLFRRHSWWEDAALASAGAGVLVLIPYWIAARAAGEVSPGFNVVIHLLGDAGVFLFLLVPRLHIWVRQHVTTGR